MVLDPLSHELNSFAARHGITHRLTATAILGVANELAEGRFRAVAFKAGRLTIAVGDAETRYIVQPTLRDFLDRLNSRLGERRVNSVGFRFEPTND